MRCDGDPPLTHVTLVWQEGLREDWLRFGKPVGQRIIDRRTRVESYKPGQLFAFVRWASNDMAPSIRLSQLRARSQLATPIPRFRKSIRAQRYCSRSGAGQRCARSLA